MDFDAVNSNENCWLKIVKIRTMETRSKWNAEKGLFDIKKTIKQN